MERDLSLTFARLDFSEEITVFVGEEKKRFTVHKCFLTKSSDFLEACCKGPWKESQANRVELPNMDRQYFSIYLQWLYTGHLVIRGNDGDDADDDDFGHLIVLAAIAGFLCDSAFANTVSDALITAVEKFDVLPSASELHNVVEFIPASSIFYTLFVEYFATTSDAADFQDYPPKFVLDVLAQTLARRDSGDWEKPSWTRRCRYHEHNERTPFLAECKDAPPKTTRGQGGRRHNRST